MEHEKKERRTSEVSHRVRRKVRYTEEKKIKAQRNKVHRIFRIRKAARDKPN